MGSVGQPSPCCRGRNGPAQYIRNDDQREADALRGLRRLHLRVLSGPLRRRYPVESTPGRTLSPSFIQPPTNPPRADRAARTFANFDFEFWNRRKYEALRLGVLG